jgi:hypothetical protein
LVPSVRLREAAKGILAAVTLGDVPAASRSRSRKIPIFREFAERYLAEEAVSKLKPRTVVNYRICLRHHAAPFKAFAFTICGTLMQVLVRALGLVSRASASCLATRRRARPNATLTWMRTRRSARKKAVAPQASDSTVDKAP